MAANILGYYFQSVYNVIDQGAKAID